ncbi:zinc-dependent alcohol dehydrogenase [Paenibacillus sp. LPE1-1-1.1]|uniref:zinc-dependent alcohol dehydrogenase n=1 Tax=Paenibacillus sp. LPE1-1-1.1 TaxID=3135230 RepID=UPI00341C3038
MQANVVVIHADEEPIKGIDNPTPNQIYKNVRVSLKERELGMLGPDDIRVQIAYVGICGTDVHLTTNHPETGYISCSAPLSIPEEGRVIGHEGVGKVIAVGNNMSHLALGSYVALESIIICHRCTACRRGKFNQCLNAKLLGLEQDGILGTIVDVPGSLAHDLTLFIRSESDLMAAANIEPAAVAYVGCENAQLVPGEKVAIFGAGPIGLFVAMLCRQVFGSSEIHMIEPNEFRRNFARPWADHVHDVESFFYRSIDGIDVVFEASAILQNVTRVIRRINANGRVILLGRKGYPFNIQDVDHMITNEITIKGSRGHLGGAFEKVMRLHQSNRINLLDVVTQSVHGLKEASDMLMHSERIEQENCKVIVNVSSY